MTAPWVKDVTTDDLPDSLGWWATPTPDISKSNHALVSAVAGQKTVSWSHTVAAEREHVMSFIAARGVFTPGSLGWSYQGLPGTDDLFDWEGIAPGSGSKGSLTNGFMVVDTAYNVPAGTYPLTATVTTGTSDTMTQLYAGTIGFSGASDMDMYWYQRYASGVSNAYIGGYPLKDMIAGAILSSTPLGALTSSSGVLSTASSADNRLKIYFMPGNGNDIYVNGTPTSGNWVSMAAGVRA